MSELNERVAPANVTLEKDPNHPGDVLWRDLSPEIQRSILENVTDWGMYEDPDEWFDGVKSNGLRLCVINQAKAALR